MTRYLAAFLLLAVASAHADDSGPSWYRKKKQIEKEKAEETERKAKEKPVISGDEPKEATFAQLSASAPKPPPPNLLFRKEGLTDSVGVDYGQLSQQDINGKLLSAQYAMGWWWNPDTVLSAFGRVNGLLTDTYLWVMISAGPQLRYFLSRHWAVTGNVGWAVSKGLTRVETSHIPTPPDATLLAARNGLTAGGQISYIFWSRRDLAVGPSLNFWIAKQGERSASEITLGITLQSGRPDYTGDVTER